MNKVDKIQNVKAKNNLIMSMDFVEINILNPCSCSLCNKELHKNDDAFGNMDLDHGVYILCPKCYDK